MTYIIVDFEATCCDKGTVPSDEMEIIEIGAVALHGNGQTVLDEFQSFVKPVRNPILTDFCKNLTSIKQTMVDSAPSFEQVLDVFRAWLTGFENPVFCSWGNYDKKQLRQDCAFHNVTYPFSKEHINIKQKFAVKMVLKRQVGLAMALKIKHIPFEGSHHRGIDDARNIARIFLMIL